MSDHETRTARQADLRRVLALEVGSPATAAAQAKAVRIVWHRIAERLEPVIGVRGVDALWSRAMHLAAGTHPCLGALMDPKDGVEPSPELMAEAAEALLMAFVEILEGMIGEPLTGRLLNQVWARDPAESSRETTQ